MCDRAVQKCSTFISLEIVHHLPRAAPHVRWRARTRRGHPLGPRTVKHHGNAELVDIGLARRFCEYDEVDCRVSSHSTIRVKQVTYSVPARFIGRRVRVRVSEQQVVVYHGAEPVAALPRSRDRQAVIDYRHIIQALLRKPGAFARYRHREELFPDATYRAAHDQLVRDHGQRPGELEYLRLLKLTAELGISAVAGRLSELVGEGSPPWRTESVRQFLCPSLAVYDALLGGEVADVA